METGQAKGPSPVRLAFRFGYIGSRFAGSQVQPSDRTVEGEFIAACLRAGLFSDWHEARFATAGRTDRGVHARGQIAAFTTPYQFRAVEALNWQLPPDIWCTGYAVVDADFHPRYRAMARTYRYYIFGRPVDLGRMARAAHWFEGEHDYSAFCRPAGKDPVRCIQSVRVFQEGRFTCIEVTARSFLWHMVRSMAAALIFVGEGEWDEGDIMRRLSGEDTRHVPPAVPEGLVLWDVECGTRFVPMPPDDRTVRFLRDSGRYHALMAMVTGILSPVPLPDDPSSGDSQT